MNAEKADKLVSHGTLVRRRDAVIHCWEVLRESQQDRFAREVGRALTGNQAPPADSWQSTAFARLVESIETLAVQRGIPRWNSSS